VVDAGTFDFGAALRLGGAAVEIVPFRLPGLHTLLGFAQLRPGLPGAGLQRGQLGLLDGELLGQLGQAPGVDLDVRLGLVPGLVGLRQLLLLTRAAVPAMLDGLLDAGDLGAQAVVTALHFIEGVVGLDLSLAGLFDGGLQGALIGDHGLQLHLEFL